MAWTEWHGKVLPSTDQSIEISCSIAPPDSSAKAQWWSLSLEHSVRNPLIEKRNGLELDLSIEIGNLGFQLSDWSQIGNQTIIATPAWHAATETIGPYGQLINTWLSVHAMQHDFNTGRLQHSQWRADYFRVTFSPSASQRFPCEIDAWLVREEAFHAGAPLSGKEINKIPTGPPNLRIIGLAHVASGSLTFQSRNADPIVIARRRLAETIALHDPGELTVTWWAETERRHSKRELPPPDSELRRADVAFRLPEP